jgi:Iap family predicted aminopeptidase
MLLIVFTNSLFALDKEKLNSIVGSAYSESIGYDFLERLCMESGGRLAGSENSIKAREIIKKQLESLGYKVEVDNYDMPGWIRGESKAHIVKPYLKELRIYALGYSQSMADSRIVAAYIGCGDSETIKNIDVKNKIALIDINDKKNGCDAPTRYDAILNAKNAGAKAVVFGSEKDGGMVLASGVGFDGSPSPIPAFIVAKEDFKSISASVKKGISVEIEISNSSKCQKIGIANIRAILPGESKRKIVVGAHYDSWDISTGAVDNGTGCAVLMDIARIIKKYSMSNKYTIEFVWFDAEELGLVGAKRYCERYSDSVVAMINMDMPGTPTGVDIMGFESFRSAAEEFLESFKGYKFSRGVDNTPWINSDHTPFLLKGIPCFTFHGDSPKEVYWHYHDYADTFDKVDKRILSDATAIIGAFVLKIDEIKDLEDMRLSEDKIIELMKSHKLDIKLKKQKEWHFKD